MDTTMKIIAAGAMLLMVVFLWPRAKQAMEHSPKA